MKRLLLILTLLVAVPLCCRAQLVISANLSGIVNAPIDQNGWQSFKVVLTQNVTFNFVVAPPAPLPAQSTLRVIFTQDATGGRTVTFAANIANACTVNAAANATTTCQFTFDGTTATWQGVGGAGGGITQTGPLAGASGGGIWQKTRFAIPADPTSATVQGNTQEMSVLCESSPQVLTAGVPLVCGPPGTAVTANAVIKIWYTCGYTSGNICYAETLPPFTTVAILGGAASPTVLISGHAHGRVFKNGSTYHFYEAIKTAGVWSTGIATSTDGAGNTWTKNASVNPLCTNCGGPEKYKDPSGNYWIWTHSAIAGSGLPSDVFRWQLTGLTTTPTLTASPSTCVLCRGEVDEGFNTTTGQLADVSHIEVNGVTLVFYEGTYDGGRQTAFLHGRMAVANLPWAALVLTNEGVAASSPNGNAFNMLMVGSQQGIPGPIGGISVNNSTNSSLGYPGLNIGQFSNGGGDLFFLGVNELATGSTRTRGTTAGGGALLDCSMSSTNSGVGCFMSFINTSGTESFPINAGLNSNGNAQIILADTLAGGVVPTLTGTGACATFSGVATGGANAGQFTCTGTTGASTVTLTFNTTASHAWACSASDVTTTLAASQVTPLATTTCKLNFTSVAANDVITFQAKGY